MHQQILIIRTVKLGEKIIVFPSSNIESGSVYAPGSEINKFKHVEEYGLDNNTKITETSILEKGSVIAARSYFSLSERSKRDLPDDCYVDVTDFGTLTKNALYFDQIITKYNNVNSEKEKILSNLDILNAKIEEEVKKFDEKRQEYQQRICDLQTRNSVLSEINDVEMNSVELLIEEEKRYIKESELMKKEILKKEGELRLLNLQIEQLDKTLIDHVKNHGDSKALIQKLSEVISSTYYGDDESSEYTKGKGSNKNGVKIGELLEKIKDTLKIADDDLEQSKMTIESLMKINKSKENEVENLNVQLDSSDVKRSVLTNVLERTVNMLEELDEKHEREISRRDQELETMMMQTQDLETLVTRLRHENQELKYLFDTNKTIFEEKIKSSNDQISALESKFRASEESYSELKESHQKLEHLHESLKKYANETTTKLRELEEENYEAHDHIEIENLEHDELVKQNLKLKNQSTSYERRIESLQTELERVRDELSNLDSKHVNVLDHLMVKHQQILNDEKSKYSELQTKHSELQNRHSELQSKHLELSSKYSELQARNSELSVNLQSHKDVTSELQSKIHTHEQEHANLLARIHILESELEANCELRNENKILSEKFTAMSNQIIDLKQIIANHENNVNLEDSVETAEIIRELSSLSQMLQSKVNDLEIERENLQNEISELKAVVSEQNVCYDDLLIRSRKLHNFSENLSSKLKSISSDYELETVYEILDSYLKIERELKLLHEDESKRDHDSKRDTLEIARLQSEIRDKDLKLSELLEKIRSKTKEIELKDSVIEEKIRKIESKNRDLDDMDCELQNKNMELDDKDSELEEKIREIESKNSEIEEKNREIESKNSEIEEKNRELESRDQKLEIEDSELEDKIREIFKLTDSNKILTSTLEMRDREIQGKEQEIKSLNSEVSNLKTKYISASEENKILKMRESKRRKKTDMTSGAADESDLNIVSSNPEPSNQSGELANANRDIDELTSQLIEEKLNSNMLQNTIIELTSLNNNISEMNAKLESERIKYQTDFEKLSKDLEILMKEKQEKEENEELFKKLLLDLSLLKDEISKLNIENESLRRENEIKIKECDDLIATVNSLIEKESEENELSKLNIENESLRRENEIKIKECDDLIATVNSLIEENEEKNNEKDKKERELLVEQIQEMKVKEQIMEQESDKLVESILSISNEEQTLELKLKTTTEEVANLKFQLDAEKELTKYYKSKYDEISGDIATLADSYTDLEQKVLELARTNVDQRSTIEYLRSQNLERTESRSESKTEIVPEILVDKTEIQTLKQELDTLKTQNDELVKILENKRQKASELNEIQISRKLKSIVLSLVSIESDVNKEFIRYLKDKENKDAEMRYLNKGIELRNKKNDLMKELESLLNNFTLVLNS